MSTIESKYSYKAGRLLCRPQIGNSFVDYTTGLHRLNIDDRKDGFIYVPQKTNTDFSLAVMLHGSGGTAEQAIALLRDYADQMNTILLAPASRDYSWDIITRSSFGPDV